jgi:hypothetical protein
MEKETKQRHSARKIVLAVVAVTALAAMCIFAVKDVQQRKAAAYQGELVQLAERIQEYAVDAYEVAAAEESVWRNSIYQQQDESTDPYTMENGVFLEDFDDALGNLYNDSVFAARLASVQTNRGSAAGSMSGLKDAPEGYEDVYQALKEQYDAYIKLTNLALNNGGYTYEEFNRELGELVRELNTCYLTIATYVG